MSFVSPDHPPRPRLTLRVGVTGHRWDKLRRDDSAKLLARFDHVFEEIEDITREIHEAPNGGYRDPRGRDPEPPAPILRLLSGLAEGADRLAAKAAQDRGGTWQLTAILPFARETYVGDFVMKDRQPSGFEFDRQPKTPDLESIKEFEDFLATATKQGGVQELDGMHGSGGRYVPLAEALAHNVDVLIAIWNGKKEEVKPGGTGDVIARATELGIPVVRIPLDGVDNPWIDDAEDGGFRAPLEERLKKILLAPAPKANSHGRPDLREAYFRSSGGLAQGGEATHVIDRRDRWQREWSRLGVPDELSNALIATGLHRHYAWASYLANRNASLYRNSFVLNYTLSWLAVGAAAVGFSFPELGPAMAAAEFALLLGIILVFVLGSRWKFHARWLDYRRLAEWLRSLPMLLPVSRTPVRPVTATPLFGSGDNWVDWMFRGVMREVGILPVNLGKHVAGAEAMLGQVVLKGQVTYHDQTAERHRDRDQVLHWASGMAFFLAFVLSAYHLAGLVVARGEPAHETQGSVLKSLIQVLALTLPALGAALHCIRSQAEHELTADRSEEIKDRLTDLSEELGGVKSVTLDRLAGLAQRTAMVMNAELSAWFVAYQNKDIPLP